MHTSSTMKTFCIFLGFLFFTCSVYAQIIEKTTSDGKNVPKSYPIHASDLLWQKEQTVRKYITEHPEAVKSNALGKTTAWGFSIGSTHSWYADDLTSTSTDPSVSRYLVPSTCRAVGTHCYVFVEDASWTARVTQTEVDSVRIYFDSKTPANPSKGIYQMDTEAFGNPPNVDGDDKIIVLLLDIKDGFSGSGGYVVGYFYSFNETSQATSNQAEIYFLDTYPLNLRSPAGLRDGLATTAHEFQHMIHFNYDMFENTFINEGCSLVAEVNCGFPIYSPGLYTMETNHYLYDWRSGDYFLVDNDYSRAARFTVYIRDQFGIGVFKNIVASTQVGTAGINAGLQAYGSSFRFSDILPNWFIANILDDTLVNPKYGYKYPDLPKASGYVFSNPIVPLTTDTVQRYAARYLHFNGGGQLKATFTSGSSALLMKAVEIGPSVKRVLDVPANIEFSEPGFGTTYYDIYFIVMNTDPSNQAIYSYTATGNGGSIQTTFSYAGSAYYYFTLPSSNLKFATRFSPTVSGQLYSVSIALNGLDNAIIGNGNLRVAAYQNNPSGSIGGTPSTQIGTNVLVPFSQLNISAWNVIDMQSANVFVTAGTDFHIVMDIVNAGDTLQFLMDNGITAPTNRTSSYRVGVNGLGWYNRADPNFGSGKAPSYENLLVSATISEPVIVIEAPTNLSATEVSPTQINLHWTDTSTNEQGFKIERKTGAAGVYSEIASVGVDSTSYQDHSVAANKSYYYRVRAYSGGSYSNYSNEVGIIRQSSDMQLSVNHPNPFRMETVIGYSVPNSTASYIVTLKIFNMLGQEIAVLVNEQKPSGYYEVKWNALHQSSGVYFYRLRVTNGNETYSEVKKMVLIK
jgi:hypothetical protein